MATAWPASLPRMPMEGSLSYAPVGNTTGSDNDVGGPIMRRRFTGMTVMESGTLACTRQQADDLFNFWADTLAQGTLEFSMKSWRDGVIRDYSFPPNSPPQFSRTARTYYCALSLRYTITT